MKRIIISFVVFPAILSAQSRLLSVDECCRLALDNNRKITVSALQTDQAELIKKSLKANYFPDISVSAIGAYSTASGSYQIEGGNLPVFQVGEGGVPAPTGGFAYFPGIGLDYKIGPAFRGGVDVRQPIYTGGKIPASVAMAESSVAMASSATRLEAVNVIVETSKAYADLVKAKKMLEVAVAYKTAVTELGANVESAVNHGLRHSNDRLKVKVRENEADLNILKAKNAIRLSKMNLCHVIGLPMTSDIDVAEVFPDIEMPDDIAPESSVVNRPETSILDARSRMLSSQVRISRSEMLPKIGLQAGYYYDYGLELNGRRMFNDGAFSVFLNVSVPIFHFGERSNKVKADKIRYQQSLLEKEDSMEKMELEMRLAYSRLEESQAEFQMMETSLRQAAENMRLSKAMFDNGMETLSDYLEAQVLWHQANQQFISSGFSRYVNFIDYKRAGGMLKSDVAD